MNEKVKLAVGAALLGLSVSANAAVIDLFSTHQGMLSDTGVDAITGLTDGVGSSGSVSTGGLDIIGGERDLYVETLSSDSQTGGVANTFAKIGVVPTTAGAGDGKLTFSTDDGAAGTGVVQWDGADAGAIGSGNVGLDVTGLGSIDLTEGGSMTSFALDILSSDLGFEFVLEIYTDATHWSKATLLSSGVSTPETHYLLFSDFLLCGAVTPTASITCGAGNTQAADFADVGALQLIIDPNGGTLSLDMSIDSARTVPEPSVLGLMGAGLLAGGFVARRRRNQSKTA